MAVRLLIPLFIACTMYCDDEDAGIGLPPFEYDPVLPFAFPLIGPFWDVFRAARAAYMGVDPM